MEFRFTPEEEAFRQELRTFLKKELPPDWSGGDVEVDSEEQWQFTLQMKKKLGQRGWLTMAWPKEYGGGGASHMAQLIYAEEMAYRRAPGVDIWGVRMLAPILMMYGTEEQRKTFLPPIAHGEIQWCQGYSEPEAGSDLASLTTRAKIDGDDFIINGTKVWTSMAHRADWMFILARTDPEAPKHRGISFILVDLRTPGVTISPIIDMAGRHHFNMEIFEDVRVPRKNLVGELNRGWYVGAALLDFERSGINYSATARRTLEDVVAFAKETKHDGKPLAANTLVRHTLAEMAIEIETSRLTSYNVAWMQSQGKVPNKEASVVKLFGTELGQRVAQVGLSVMGLYGQLEPGSKWAPLKGHLERSWLSSFSGPLASGTSEIMRNIIAQRGLGMPRE
ncbi:MAG: acyl-CoA dehydrogenase family protein [Chloroflexi bacterium]|nr:acyl-CoA dehydrogenase family protein [Chloroflexota bacterium]